MESLLEQNKIIFSILEDFSATFSAYKKINSAADDMPDFPKQEFIKSVECLQHLTKALKFCKENNITAAHLAHLCFNDPALKEIFFYDPVGINLVKQASPELSGYVFAYNFLNPENKTAENLSDKLLKNLTYLLKLQEKASCSTLGKHVIENIKFNVRALKEGLKNVYAALDYNQVELLLNSFKDKFKNKQLSAEQVSLQNELLLSIAQKVKTDPLMLLQLNMNLLYREFVVEIITGYLDEKMRSSTKDTLSDNELDEIAKEVKTRLLPLCANESQKNSLAKYAHSITLSCAKEYGKLDYYNIFVASVNQVMYQFDHMSETIVDMIAPNEKKSTFLDRNLVSRINSIVSNLKKL